MRLSPKLMCLLVIPTLVWADGCGNLLSSLQRLHGHSPVEMEVTYGVRQEQTTFLNPLVRERSLRFHVVEDTAGLRVIWNLPTDSAPQQETIPDLHGIAAMPLEEVLKDLDAVTLAGLLNQADALSRLLKTAQFKSESHETYRGNPLQVLTYTCNPRVLIQHQGRVTQAESTLRIWIDSDGVPVATESLVDYVGQHSRLYGRIHSHTQVTTTYAVLGHRLVVTSRNSEDSIYDYGEKLKKRMTLILVAKG